MGVLFDYFAAPSDQHAATTIDLVGGPGEAGLPVLQANGIDPVVQMGTLEALLTGVEYDTVVTGPRSGQAVAVRDEGERVVVTVTDALQEALGHASPQRLAAVALPWSQTKEFWGNAEPEVLVQFLHQLAELARDARANGDRLYCWMSV